MKIALLGYGKMGRLLDTLAEECHCKVVARLDKVEKEEELCGAEVAIDFSHAAAVLSHATIALRAGCDMVIGTTGWDEEYDAIYTLIKESGRGAIYAPNFSIGVHLFLRMVKQSAKLIQNFPEYDTACLEWHHRQKADAPSGTAQAISESLLKQLPNKQHALLDRPQGRIDAKELHSVSVRCGSIPGTHTVVYDSPCDTIELTHRARNREGFARGALRAAHWIAGKRGFFTLDDLLEEAVPCT